MINIQVNQDEIKRPEVYEAVMVLLGHLSGVNESLAPAESKPTKSRRKDEQVGKPDIDEEIQEHYGHLISKAKSLYFLSIIKNNGSTSCIRSIRTKKTFIITPFTNHNVVHIFNKVCVL